jgi:acyl-CoA thioester hydrolase
MPHRITRAVEAADIDELGHASNLTYLRWVVEAAVSHTTHLGLGPLDYRKRGQSFVVRRHTIDYLRPALAGDRVIVETCVVSLRTASSERETVIVHAETGARLVEATSLWAFVDLEAGRPVRIPPDVRAIFTVEPALLASVDRRP